jgi:glycosyltransferase involved in cell wall biosynthesis
VGAVTESHPAVLGILVTYRRPAGLAQVLRALGEQRRPLDRLVVVDNDPRPENRRAVEAHAADGHPAVYVAVEENLGPAGGIAEGMRHHLVDARDDDWIVSFDDDDPPQRDSLLQDLEALALEMRGRDPRTGMVGTIGARFDWRRGRLTRLDDDELDGPVAVDYIGGNHFPFMSVGAIRNVGPFNPDLFFGLDDLDFGLRLRAAGYRIYVDGAAALRQRRRWGRLGIRVDPSLGLGEPTWRRYYSLRNAIFILRSHGRTASAVRVSAVNGLLKPVANLVREPKRAAHHLKVNWRALRDGWAGRLGRTIQPPAE